MECHNVTVGKAKVNVLVYHEYQTDKGSRRQSLLTLLVGTQLVDPFLETGYPYNPDNPSTIDESQDTLDNGCYQRQKRMDY